MAIAVGGLVIISGWKERLMALLSTLAVLVLMIGVIGTHPAALYDPFGGLIKDACLFVCAAIVWWWPPSLLQAPQISLSALPRQS